MSPYAIRVRGHRCSADRRAEGRCAAVNAHRRAGDTAAVSANRPAEEGGVVPISDVLIPKYRRGCPSFYSHGFRR